MLGIWSRTVRNTSGGVIDTASVEVREVQDPDNVDAAPITKATIYEDFDGTVAKANPFDVDADGRAEFYADGEFYHIIISDPATSVDAIYANQPIGTAQSRDFGVGDGPAVPQRSDADARYARQSQNLADLNDAPTARTNLGLGDAAVKGVSGLAATVVSGGAGVAGNLGEYNADGDLVDTGIASSAVFTSTDDIDISGQTKVSVASGDLLLIEDTSDADAKKSVTAQDIANLSGGAVTLDLGNDGAVESTALDEVATSGDTNSIFTEPSADKLLIDMSKNWPTADQAAALLANAVDAITEIAAALRTGADTTLVTGTAGTDGNLTQWNSDGDAVDSGKAAADVDSGKVDPEHATDSGTDAFVSATNTTPPADGVKITRDFQSANTTTTPTLDGKTMTTRDGSALWADAVSGPHELQYASGTDTYLVLEPLPIDEDDMASDSAAAVPTQQSVKAYALTDPGTSSDPALAFDTWRTPNANRLTLVSIRISAETDGTSTASVIIDVDESGGTTTDYFFRGAFAEATLNSGVTIRESMSFLVPAGGSYRIRNDADPNSNNAIGEHREFTL